MMALHLSKIPNWLKGLISLLATLILAVTTNVIGNGASKVFEDKILPFIKGSTGLPRWISITILLVVIFCSIIPLQHYRKAHQISSKLHSLVETLLLLLPKVYVAQDVDQALVLLLDEFLEKTLEFLQMLEGCGIAVYALDPQDPNYLAILSQVASPNEDASKARFYVGTNIIPHTPRGIAAFTFLEQKTCVVHLIRKNGQIYADHEQYVYLLKRDRLRLPYKSLIAVPILGDGNNCIGTLCLYSSYYKAFDSPGIQTLLNAITGHLSAAMQIARTRQNAIP
jgi:hypothetical protein